jgi:hypothetical protein
VCPGHLIPGQNRAVAAGICDLRKASPKESSANTDGADILVLTSDCRNLRLCHQYGHADPLLPSVVDTSTKRAISSSKADKKSQQL